MLNAMVNGAYLLPVWLFCDKRDNFCFCQPKSLQNTASLASNKTMTEEVNEQELIKQIADRQKAVFALVAKYG